jgi:hypothetical protein
VHQSKVVTGPLVAEALHQLPTPRPQAPRKVDLTFSRRTVLMKRIRRPPGGRNHHLRRVARAPGVGEQAARVEPNLHFRLELRERHVKQASVEVASLIVIVAHPHNRVSQVGRTRDAYRRRVVERLRGRPARRDAERR